MVARRRETEDENLPTIYYTECPLCWPEPSKTLMWRNGKGVCLRCRYEPNANPSPFEEK